MSLLRLGLVGLIGHIGLARAQFVFPKASYHESDPSSYNEDPFVTHYRTEFFAVFKGDIPRFHKAFAEIQAIVRRNPHDAKALAWQGNGEMIEAGLQFLKGKTEDGRILYKASNRDLDAAVKLDPENYNVYGLRAATLIVAAERYPKDWIDVSVWTRMRDDCRHLIRSMGADRLAKTSIHMRGEIYGCLGLAYAHLSEKEKARQAFETVIELDPGTDYETRAKKEIAALK